MPGPITFECSLCDLTMSSSDQQLLMQLSLDHAQDAHGMEV